LPNADPATAKTLIAEIQLLLPRVQAGLKNYIAWPQPPVRLPETLIDDAIHASARSYPGNPLPILAIYAVPHKCDKDCNTPDQNAAMQAFIDAFAKGHPNAHILRWPNTEHNLHHTREADVVRTMDAFMDGLPK
jgi:hypothetical protein